jgi:hypothetical protein
MIGVEPDGSLTLSAEQLQDEAGLEGLSKRHDHVLPEAFKVS